MTNFPYLSVLIFFPILIGLGMIFAPLKDSKVTKLLGTVMAVASLIIACGLTSFFFSADNKISFQQSIEWIPNLGASYFVGIDSVAAWMILLTAFLTVVAALISKPAEKSNQFFGLLLCLEGTLFGVFSSLDLLLFYAFFELSLIPVGLMILNWGTGDKGKVAIRYVAVLFGGSLLMLVGMVILASQARAVFHQATFNSQILEQYVRNGLWAHSWPLQSLAFWGFMIAFLVKSPAVPMHRWLASTYDDAPIGAIVAGVVMKVGTFGMFRFVLPLFPEACQIFAPIIIGIGVVGIIYGGILAAVQKTPGRLMAYSTVSHVGYILIGLFSLNQVGMMGAAFQQVNHGIAAAAIFVLLSFLYERSPLRTLSDFGGLKKSMPIFSTLFLIAMLTNLGLPFTSGFIGEILALIGVFTASYSGAFSIVFAIVAAGGAILSAAYMLYFFQRLFYGKAQAGEAFKDLTLRETLIGGSFAVLILVLGIMPMIMLKSLEPRVEKIQSLSTGTDSMSAQRTTIDSSGARLAQAGETKRWK